MENIILCKYGCGNDGIHTLKNGSPCCSISCNKCPGMRKKNSDGAKQTYKKGKHNNNHIVKGVMNGWENKSKEEVSSILRKSHSTFSYNVTNGITVPHFKGKTHTLESKQKISNAMTGTNNGLVKTKYYKIYNPLLSLEVTVQGSYELAYAKYLNDNNIKWIKSRTISLNYKLSDSDYWHVYYPDFYLVDSDTYIEIKGFYWKSKDGRVDDKRKMEKVKEYNQEKNIQILMKADLLSLGLDVK